MKRIISCFIALSMILSFAAFAVADEANNNAEVFAKGMGIIDETTYSRDKIITRAEFAGILADLLRLNDPKADEKEWQENNTNQTEDSTVSIDLSVRRFSDVDISHPYYQQILEVCRKGYLNGVSENLFAPEYNLVMKDAVRVFVNMLGYSEMAKLNSSIADTIGLTDGIDIAMDKPATYGAVIKLIYNALDINVLEIKFDSAEASYETSDETFMTAILKMDKVKGVMTDNGYTTFTGISNLGEDRVRVGDVIVNLSEETEYIKDFLGHKTELYYYTDDDEYQAAYAEIAKNDDSITFDIADFESYDGSSITYFNGTRNVKKSLANNIYLIYNGEAKTVFDKDIFDFESGDVTIIATSGSGYDLIVVTCYEFVVVSSVNAKNGKIYNKIKDPKNSALNEIDCSENGEYETVTVKDATGNDILLSDINSDAVLNILRNSRDITITVSTANVAGFNVTMVSRNEEDTKTLISNSDKTYEVSEVYENYSQKTSFVVGATYTIYLNMFDNVVWAEKYAGGDNIGILTKVRFDEEDIEPVSEMRVFSSGGKLERLTVAEKIKYNDANKKFEDLITELEEYYGKAIMYTLDTNGVVTKITTPEAFGKFGDRGWHEIAPEGDYTYHANDNDLSQMMFKVSGVTTLFTVPSNASDYNNEKAFSVNTYSFADNGKVTATGYSKDKYSVIADVIVVKSNGASLGAVSALSDVFVIDKISKGLNADDEIIDVMSGWLIDISAQDILYTTLSVSDECVLVDQKGKDLNTNPDVKLTGPKNFSDLEPGDIIRYDTNVDKEVYKIRIAFDSSTGSYFNTGDGGYGSDLSLYPGQIAASTAGSTWAGYALTKSGTGVRITKGVATLPSSINLSDASTVKNSLWAFKVNRPNAILVVEKNDNGKIKMYKGSINDLMTYQNTSKNADTDVLVMLTEWSTATRGTVIYKNFSFED